MSYDAPDPIADILREIQKIREILETEIKPRMINGNYPILVSEFLAMKGKENGDK